MVYLDLYPDSQSGSGSGSTRAKMTHKNRKKVIMHYFNLSTGSGCSLLRAEGFFVAWTSFMESSRSKLQFLINKIKKNFPAVFFFLNFWSSKP
jgi:hypothetical protein